jgi:hypothetical protein
MRHARLAFAIGVMLLTIGGALGSDRLFKVLADCSDLTCPTAQDSCGPNCFCNQKQCYLNSD